MLHDIGKLVLGFFFWEWTTRLLGHSRDKSLSFRQAEIDMGDVAGHQKLGQLLLINADKGGRCCRRRRSPSRTAGDDGVGMCRPPRRQSLKAVGLGFLPGEEPQFDKKAMAQVGVSAAAIENIQQELEQDTVEQIRTVVTQCM